MGCHIRVKDLALSYRWNSFEKTIFQNLNLCIETGSFVTITGRNGCGKSSLLKLILGLSQADQGLILLDDVPIVAGNTEAVRNGQISYLAQHIEELFYADTVEQELSYGQKIEHRRLEPMLDELGLSGFMQRSLESLSGGERQGIALAQFLIQDVPLLILDEPTSYLDNQRAELLKGHLNRAHQAGKTILHATQYPEEVNWGTHLLDLDRSSLEVQVK